MKKLSSKLRRKKHCNRELHDDTKLLSSSPKSHPSTVDRNSLSKVSNADKREMDKVVKISDIDIGTDLNKSISSPEKDKNQLDVLSSRHRVTLFPSVVTITSKQYESETSQQKHFSQVSIKILNIINFVSLTNQTVYTSLYTCQVCETSYVYYVLLVLDFLNDRQRETVKPTAVVLQILESSVLVSGKKPTLRFI